MALINEGYKRKCRNSIAGIKAVWLLKWIKHPRSSIVIDGNYLVEFPSQFIYKFESVTPVNASETLQQNEGGKYYEQTISMSFKAKNSKEFSEFIKNDYRLVFLDNNGFYRIFGLYNGMQGGDISFTTGNGKGDLNGYTISFNGQEEIESSFIENLEDIGLIERGNFTFDSGIVKFDSTLKTFDEFLTTIF